MRENDFFHCGTNYERRLKRSWFVQPFQPHLVKRDGCHQRPQCIDIENGHEHEYAPRRCSILGLT